MNPKTLDGSRWIYMVRVMRTWLCWFLLPKGPAARLAASMIIAAHTDPCIQSGCCSEFPKLYVYVTFAQQEEGEGVIPDLTFSLRCIVSLVALLLSR
ncbi:hypothetical protein BDB00DRAFT_805848 [Zychaea mexicana]|uniref:uncharacterized protein n=1 Tax=Zychaea mexicana TaxID=64656 RepID=UPI0022FE26B4|nr:uncharacterized protein BDB00DRAFT_805848 [Zychaea mexicana]KAI9497297.1 hypothetical protein BDB00DRAFT_805848 [Zychaea mexicana]